MLRRVLTFVCLVSAMFCGADAYAQSTEYFRNRLSLPDTLYNSRVVVTERGDAGGAVKMLESQERKALKVKGYRIRIFFDNKQDSRSMATATRNRFSELFPDVSVQVDYENPYWKVTAGDCLTNEEAIILWGRVKGVFDRAFVIREDIPVTAFGEKRQ